MAELATQMVIPNRERIRALVTPREHGAWGMMLVPLLTGAAVGFINGGEAGPVLWLLAAAVSLFWLRTPVESLLGTTPMRPQTREERRTVVRVAIALAVAVTGSLVMLFRNGGTEGLLWIGLLCGAAFAAQAILKNLGRRFRTSAQLVGAFGLTATAPAAYYAMTGSLDSASILLWVMNWLFAADQILYVQLRIHSARLTTWAEKWSRGRAFLGVQVVIACVVLAMWQVGWLSVWGVVCFAPVLWRGMAWLWEPAQALNVRRLGWTELAHAVVFGVLFVLSLGR